jgi:ABC-type proline/glycine betaine transport system ATPase subunit
MRDGKVEQAGSIHDLQHAPATSYVKQLFDQARAGHAALGRHGT